jgi:hypothetical protein
MVEPVLIAPEALYDDSALHQSLGLSPASVAAGRRAGMLRYTRQGKRTLYLGKWILAWLESAPCPELSKAANSEGAVDG